MRVVKLASKRLPTSWGYPVPKSKKNKLGHLSKRGGGCQGTKSLSLLPDHGPQPGIKAASY